MRCFLGTKIDENLLGRVREIKNQFKEIDGDIKFVGGENLHFTVKFLGDVDEGKIERVDVTEDVVKDFKPFKVEVEGVGVFPSKSYIKVIWIGVDEGKSKFTELINEIDLSLSKEGFEPEENETVPHLTIGRMKSGKNKERVASKVKELGSVRVGKMKINKVTLFESDLTSEGPIYKKLKDYEL